MTDPADQGEPVLLEAHPGPAAEPQPPAGQLGLDLLHGDGQPGGQAFEDDDETLPVGLAGGEEAQHDRILTVTGTCLTVRTAGLHRATATVTTTV